MTAHAEDALRCPSISEVLDLALAVSAPKACGTERLVAGENGELFDLVSACRAAVRAVVADEGAIAEEEEVVVRVEEGVAGMTAEAVEMPSVAGYLGESCVSRMEL